jgi:hypothetical protein
VDSVHSRPLGVRLNSRKHTSAPGAQLELEAIPDEVLTAKHALRFRGTKKRRQGSLHVFEIRLQRSPSLPSSAFTILLPVRLAIGKIRSARTRSALNSFIEQKIRPIRCLRPIVLGLRQGQVHATPPKHAHPIAPINIESRSRRFEMVRTSESVCGCRAWP